MSVLFVCVPSVQRGSLTQWIDDTVAQSWHYQGSAKRGV